MRKAFGAVLGAVGLAGLLLAGPAAAQEQPSFTFVLSNELKDLSSDIESMIVSCLVCSTAKCSVESEDISTSGLREGRIGRGLTTVTAGGAASFGDKITVPVTIDPATHDPTQARSWSCQIGFSNGSAFLIEPSFDIANPSFRFAQAKKGTQLVTEVGGQIKQ
jgi:hypothetical protein